jgi:hypothetical protein
MKYTPITKTDDAITSSNYTYGKWFFRPSGSVLLAQNHVPFSSFKVDPSKYSQLVYETSTKPVAIKNLNLL